MLISDIPTYSSVRNLAVQGKVRLFQRAAFPVRKTLEVYEWNALRLPSTLHPDELSSCQFVRDKKNLVLYGPVGTGKTQLLRQEGGARHRHKTERHPAENQAVERVRALNAYLRGWTGYYALSDAKTVIVEAWMPLARCEIAQRAIKKTLTIPKWLNDLAEKHHVNFSHTLQSALKRHLGIRDPQ